MPGSIRSGRRLVVVMYLIAVAAAGVGGLLLGVAVSTSGPPGVGGVGPVEFALTPVNLAVFGVVAIGSILGAFILLVEGVSRRFVTEDAHDPGTLDRETD